MTSASRPRWLRWLATVAAVGLAAYFVRAAGPAALLAHASEGGPWIPFLMALQLGIVILDVGALRHLLGGGEEAPRHAWLRATALAFACDVFLPAGRAAGEALRAATLKRWFGAARSAQGGARQQACSLLATGTASGLAGLASLRSPTLAALLGGNAVLCCTLGFALLAVLENRQVANWVRPLLERIFGRTPAGRSEVSIARAYGLCLSGRLVQVLQYGIALLAVGGTMTPRHAFAASGIHLVGATAGDFLPGQLGATEGAYAVFASAIDLDPAAALSLVVLVRAALVLVAMGALAAAGIAGRSHELA